MKQQTQEHLVKVLGHLYINPLEKCNLRCKICYTRKTNPILTEVQILEFISRYRQVHRLETITFCGGEVFALSYFPELVNILNQEGIFTPIITNGTLDRLTLFEAPNQINLIVSLDGLPKYHDANRGQGNFAKSLAFIKHAKGLGFHLDIFSIVTRQNLSAIDAFETYLASELGFLPGITYHPRKPPLYLQTHPVSNLVGETQGFDFLTNEELVKLMKSRSVFPPNNLGCYQISLASDGKVYGCCEGTIPLGHMSDPIDTLTNKLSLRLETWDKMNQKLNCLGCSQPDFVCGIKQLLMI